MHRRAAALLSALALLGAAVPAAGCGDRNEINRDREAEEAPGAEPAPEGGTVPAPGGVSEDQ